MATHSSFPITVLLVEDEAAIRDVIRFALPTEAYNILEAADAKQAFSLLQKHRPDIIILDWMLPGDSGIKVMKTLKNYDGFHEIPIMMLTAKAEEDNKVSALENGADDYLTKPFSPAELMARIKALLRRRPYLSQKGTYCIADILVNTHTQQVSIENQLLHLSPIEYRLLTFLLSHPNRTYTRLQLIEHVWGMQSHISERTVDVEMRRVRLRLKPFGKHELIHTVRGSGYLFSQNIL